MGGNNDFLRLISGNAVKVLVLLSLTVLSSQAYAGAALDEDNTVVQPGGATITVVQQGDEWSNWLENEQGYTIAQAENGEWFFVNGFDVDGTPLLSSLSADNSAPAGLSPGLRPSVSAGSRIPSPANVDLNTMIPGPSNSAGAGPHSGPLLFILAEFGDRQGTTSEALWANMLSNNVADYYDDVSYGNVDLFPATESFGTANNGVVGWVNAGPTHPNTAGNTGAANRVITRNAMIAADPYVNFASYDTNNNGVLTSDELSVIVIVAGYERSYSASFTPNVWGHAWCLFGTTPPPTLDGVGVGGCYASGLDGLNYAQFGEYHGTHAATMGIIVHEIGHLTFALPDLYDYDNSSRGIDYYGVMGFGSWGRSTTDSFSGETPVHPSAFSKVRKGWVNANAGIGLRSVISAGHNAANSNNTVYRLNTSNANQYFLVENRNEDYGYDRGLNRASGSANDICGVAIWHIDDSQTNNDNDANRWVDLEEADNFQGFPAHTDMFYSGNETDFNDNTAPSSRLNNNATTGITVSQISACGLNMTVNFGAPRVCNGKVVTIMGTAGYDTIYGTAGADVIAGLTGNDEIRGLGGNDTICGDAGNDILVGGDGADWIWGAEGNDRIHGQIGNDTLLGGVGGDSIWGSQGNDEIRGGNGWDAIDGGPGDDTLYGDNGNDRLLGRAGADIIYGGQHNDTIDAGTDPDFVDGGNGNDVIEGGLGDDLLYGGSDVDVVRGWAGDDILYGQNGADTLIGGVGDDNMYGGFGIDTCTTDATDTDPAACEITN